MPPRLNKRQQRELQEQQLLAEQSAAAPAEADAEVSEEEESHPTVTKVTNLFGALNAGGDEEEEEEEEEEEHSTARSKSKRKPKKKKKRVSAAGTGGDLTPSTPALPVAQETTPEPSTSTPKEPTKKKKKPKKDEFERALEELAQKYPDLRKPEPGENVSESQTVGAHQTTAATRLRALLQVSYKDLDASAELRRFFGSRVIAQSAAPPNKRHAAALRSRITKPQPNWPPQNTRQGISMRELEGAELNAKFVRDGREGGGRDGRWWTADHSRAYKAIESQFMQAVRSHDPNNLIALLQVYPWHVDTLLQLSNVATHQGDLSLASEFIERALFGFERCFVPAFNLATGGARLDFDRIENRPFFMALSRNIQHLQRRGCPRTAFEYARLLLQLDPAGDPHGASLLLDFLAVKAGMGAWLLETWDIWEEATGCCDVSEGMDVKALPGWAWARALAMYDAEEAKGDKVHSQSTEALRDAILGFPWVVPVLADKAGITLPGDTRAHPLFRIETSWSSSPTNTLHLLSHLYAHRSNALWKNPPQSTWFASTVASCLPLLSDPHPARSHALTHYGSETPLWICRHVIVADVPSLISFIPPKVTADIGQMYDPVPPATSVNTYNDEYFGWAESRAGLGGLEGIGEDDMRNFLQRLFGGAQGVGAEDAMLQEAIMQHIQAQQGGAGGNAQAPGGWHGAEEEFRAEGEWAERDRDDDETAGDQPGAPPRTGLIATINDLLGRLWTDRGAAGAPEEVDSEEEGYLTDRVEDVD